MSAPFRQHSSVVLMFIVPKLPGFVNKNNRPLSYIFHPQQSEQMFDK